jgi:hypothetical protein
MFAQRGPELQFLEKKGSIKKQRAFVFRDLNTPLEFSARSFELVKVNAVPIPAAIWLFGYGLAGSIGMRHKLKASTKTG